MPAFLTHYAFGVRNYKKMEYGYLKKMIHEHKTVYSLGTIGPDIFLYYYPDMMFGDKKPGTLLHEKYSRLFFENMLKRAELFLSCRKGGWLKFLFPKIESVCDLVTEMEKNLCYNETIKHINMMEAIDMAVITIQSSNFEKEVLRSKQPVLLDFFATWCMPCKMLSPIINEISGEYEHVKVCRIDIESEPELARSFQVMSIPTLVYIKDGAVVDQSIGFSNKEAIQRMLEE